ncbi:MULTISPECIES: GDYXXLXY domain-containing protein [Flavobacteriaceae]|uniref:GDYXXLXY domain-containing protein n=1 Tax=Flavobacteriaceae TaxID=49546 RepID=UPI00234BC64F|nr:GDYXXLXY domain-containing protein [Muricauda sp. SP22]MDC6362126.1 GDYXXLXY domain-containing protein [Muricauda sp. SP22]
MKKYSTIIILVNLVAFFAFFNHSIIKKEELLEQGELILLELAPVDPRSLMQGDYMRLRYTLSEDINSDSIPKRGFCVVGLDANGVAQKKRFQKERTPLGENEYLIEYTSQNRWDINIGAESYFFQEGEAEKYETAEYGAVKVDRKGNSILVGLYDADLKKIE